MKKLKRILLINWMYFSKEIIEVGDVNFLTGKNGSGKSTVIDALQVVLLGETNARNFNQAANEKSQRTLDGYLRADMDENNPFSRRGKDFSSYIACEYQDETEGKFFVTGVVFDTRSDGSRQERFFIYPDRLPESCFIENGEAMDIPSLRRYLKENVPRAELYDTQKDYRENLLSRCNIHNQQFFRMMKKAVSFRPIVDIQKFITENICDAPDQLNIEAMQQNIRDYKRHEQLALQQEDKLKELQEIGRLYRVMNQAAERKTIQSFLVQWAEKESVENQITQARQKKEQLQQESEAAERYIHTLGEEIEQNEKRRRELDIACAQSSVYQEQDKLEGERRRLSDERIRYMDGLQNRSSEIRQEAQRLNALCSAVGAFDEELLTEVQTAAESVQAAYVQLAAGDYQIFSQPLEQFKTACKEAGEMTRAVRDASHRVEDQLAELVSVRKEKQDVLANLRRNVKDYPKGLLPFRDRLAAELERRVGHPIQINILADVLELKEERWRGAVEGYLNTQKFYLLVEPDCYSTAVSIYNGIKADLGNRSFGLVDIGKLRERESLETMENSLAHQIETDHPLARSYIDYLLGRVICCDRVEQLRNYKTAVTAEGMLYQGYVARRLRRDLMNDAFIGQNAVMLRIRKLEGDLEQLDGEIAYWTPIGRCLKDPREPLLSEYFVQTIVTQAQSDFLRSLEITGEIADIESQLAQLDLLWLDEQQKTIKQLNQTIGELKREKEREIGRKSVKDSRIQDLEQEELPKLYQQQTELEAELRERYSEDYRENSGIPRYQQELARLKKPETIRKNFSDSLQRTEREQDAAYRNLVAARRNYADHFKPCSFRVEAMDNEEYAAECKSLEESTLPSYREKIKAARESAMEQFQNDFLAKLKSSIDDVHRRVRDLNQALQKAQFGTDRYQFRVERNPDYADYYEMIMAPELMEGDMGLFALPFQQKYGSLIEKLFSQITTADDTQLNARKQSELQENIRRYTDFRTYLKFDLETTDQNGSKQLLSRTLNTKSGGETQTPFYIAVLASFAQLYRVNEPSLLGNTTRLVVFDEAFNKMDSDRIIESVRLLRKMGLQAIICTPPDKVADLMPIADRTLLASKNGYHMHILTYSKEQVS